MTLWRLRQRQVRGWVIVAALIASGGLWTGGYTLANKSSDNCEAALKVRDAMQDVLEDAQKRTEATPAQTLRERDRQQALDFYDRSIKRLRSVTC